MRDIVDLSEDQYKRIMKMVDIYRHIGSGAEGTCVLGPDKKAYKIYDGICDYEYDIDKIIMRDEFDLESFAFPDRLYIYEGELCAYRMPLIQPNLFKLNRCHEIKEEALLKAIDRYVEDVRVISDKGIFTFELPFNLLFTGKRLVGVDTPSYQRTDSNTFDKNIEVLGYALDTQYDIFREVGKDVVHPDYQGVIKKYKKQ